MVRGGAAQARISHMGEYGSQDIATSWAASTWSIGSCMTDEEKPRSLNAFMVFTRAGAPRIALNCTKTALLSQEAAPAFHRLLRTSRTFACTPASRTATGSADRLACWPYGAGQLPLASTNFPPSWTPSSPTWRRLPVLETLTEQGDRSHVPLSQRRSRTSKRASLACRRKALHLDSVTWPYESLQPIDLNDWTDTVTHPAGR